MSGFNFKTANWQGLVWDFQEATWRSVKIQVGSASNVQTYEFVGPKPPAPQFFTVANMSDETLCRIALAQFMGLRYGTEPGQIPLDLTFEPLTACSLDKVPY